MCYYNGVKVTRDEYIRLKHLEKLVANYDFLARDLYLGPENNEMIPVLKRIPGKEDFEITQMRWGFLPPYISTHLQGEDFRQKFKTLNSKSENLFLNEKGKPSMFREAAIDRRCLVLSTEFYEWRHIFRRGKNGKLLKTPEYIPYHIIVKDLPYWFFAGIYNTVELDGEIIDTVSIVTQDANDMMAQIHNAKKRMPMVLTPDRAWRWLFGSLVKEEVTAFGLEKISSEEMEAYTVDKYFKTALNPAQPVHYAHVPGIWEEAIAIEPQSSLF